MVDRKITLFYNIPIDLIGIKEVQYESLCR